MTPAAFLQSYPEFAETSTTLVIAKLRQASGRMGGPDPVVWPPFGTMEAPSLTDIAQGALAAHYLALSPFGTEMRLKPRAGEGDTVRTTYLTVYEECADAVVGGFVVAGACYAPIGATGAAAGVTTGAGTASVVNGSATVTFSTVQTFPAGTVFVFYSQPGVFYMLSANMVGVTTGTLSAPYGGTTAPAAIFGYELP